MPSSLPSTSYPRWAWLLGAVTSCACLLSAGQFAFRLHRLLRRSRALTAAHRPFSHDIPDAVARVLLVGDSITAGIGLSESSRSVGGLLSSRHPDVAVENVAESGAGWARARDQIARTTGQFDLMLIMAGANDILRMHRSAPLRFNIHAALRIAKRKARDVIVIGNPDIGRAPAVPWPLDGVLTLLSRRMRNLLALECRRHGVPFVDLFRSSLAKCTDRQMLAYYAADGLHPNERSHEYALSRIDHAVRLESILAPRNRSGPEL